MFYRSTPGNALEEYGLFFGVMLTLGVSSLILLGHSISDLLGKPANGNPINSYMSSTIGSKPASSQSPASPPASQTSTPISMPGTLSLTGTTPVSVNATSVDGIKRVIDQDSQIFANAAQVAQQLPNTDPALIALLTNLANSDHALGSQVKSTGDLYEKWRNF